MKKSAAAVKKSLRKKLLRAAAENPDQRDVIFADLAKMGFEFKPLKEAGMGKTAIKPETEDFIRWALSTQTPMSPNEVESFTNRTLGIKTSPPVKRRTGPRFQKGDKVEVIAAKHKGSGLGTYKLYDGQIGTCVGADGNDLLLAMKGEPAPVRFEGGMKNRGVGVYKYTAPYDIQGSKKMEMIYLAGGKSTPDDVAVVEVYLGRGRGTERRSANYYTGHVTFAAMGGKGWYFRGFPQQRMRIDPKAQGGFRPRTFNPSSGQVLYIGVFNSRPSNWKKELASLDAALEAESQAG